jgi:mannose-1-phosphate guanylyltransferase
MERPTPSPCRCEAIAGKPAWQTTQVHLWGIVLAGGDGRRLQPFIRTCFGTERPKQYCAFLDHRSMLCHTLARAERLIPPEHLLTIITQRHLPYARAELRDRSPETIIIQPRNRETGPGILLPLLHVYLRDPEAVVVLLPADHFIREEGRFMAAIACAAAHTDWCPTYPVLLGIDPSRPEVDYGWIESGEVLMRVQGEAVHRVRRFWEKPCLDKATDLYLNGCLWNTMVLVARATVLLELFEKLTPGLVRVFEPVRQALGSPHEIEAVQTAYAMLRPINFSQAVLASCPYRLAVLPVHGVYWSDWGDPARILQDRTRFALQRPRERQEGGPGGGHMPNA